MGFPMMPRPMNPILLDTMQLLEKERYRNAEVPCQPDLSPSSQLTRNREKLTKAGMNACGGSTFGALSRTMRAPAACLRERSGRLKVTPIAKASDVPPAAHRACKKALEIAAFFVGSARRIALIPTKLCARRATGTTLSQSTERRAPARCEHVFDKNVRCLSESNRFGGQRMKLTARYTKLKFAPGLGLTRPPLETCRNGSRQATPAVRSPRCARRSRPDR